MNAVPVFGPTLAAMDDERMTEAASMYTGRCQCGAVTARISAEPLAVRQCWCRHCQQLSGGGCSVNAMFPAEAITMSGTLGDHAYRAASGNTLTQFFCAACGTPVMAASSARPQFRAVRVGFLDPGHGLRPTVAVWTDEAPAWAVIDPALERYPDQGPAPRPKT